MFATMRKYVTLLLISLVGFQLFSCKNAQKPDVSKIEVNIDSRRLDQDLYRIDTNDIASGLSQLNSQYPDFLNFYLDTLLGFGVYGQYSNENPAINEGVHSFLTYKDYVALHDSIQKYYPNVDEVNKELKSAFQYATHYLPNFQVPKIIYMSSGLSNWGAITYDSIMAIGLDMYLGKQYPFYASVGLADYLYEKFQKQYIPVAVMTSLYESRFPFNYENQTLLDLIIQRGKRQYFIEKVLPDLKENIRFGYTEPQLKWCEDNEKNIYAHFIQDRLLYEKNLQKIMKFVMDGPTTPGMPVESPGNIGCWLGLQIVKAYMDKHPEVNLNELLMLKDSEQILSQSAYKP